ncbi:glycosyltransferase family 2 protein [Leifsonia sp. A12D58]|uniref:glycosyltransferase family 2 protein n=1 Tax=Leifsonia sp. A12D58 TaxID=3397674 RepID=UPI0039E05092
MSAAKNFGERAETTKDTLAWQSANIRGRNGLFRQERLCGTPTLDAVPVIVCLWNRAARIDDILTQLDAQATDKRVRLLLWNNNAADDAYYRERIAAFVPSGALESVEYVLSPRNVGGMGRFFLAKRLLKSGVTGHFITLDDDQDLTPAFIDTLCGYAAPREFAGFWAWNYIDSHWNRNPTAPGELADYAGTGGAICDIDIVRSSDFFTKLPRRYAFLEDQWLCGYAKSLGWTIRKADVDLTFVLHETNQFPQLADLKDEFRTYLIERNATR